jgi:O-acetyl-ADP-ribose deacetylase (regulator of RNase III)
MGQDLRTDLPTVASTTRSVLGLAGDLGDKVVAMPLLGTGVGGLDLEEVATTMVGEVASLASIGSCRCERVLVVAYDDTAADAVRAAVEAL